MKQSLMVLAFGWLFSGALWAQSAWYSYPNNTSISIPSNGNVGIGTPSPDAGLVVYGNNGFRVTGSSLANFYVTPLSGTAVLGTADASNLELRTNNTARLEISSTGAVGIGTTSPQHLLHVAGTIGAEEVIVSSTGADYVFGPDYRLPSLTEVAAYIADHHHLPDIPSAADMKEKGVGVADMQAKLLAKVEELTLHMIEAEKENQELRERIARLEAAAGGKAVQ
jgi:hypothetical protein